MGGFKLPKKNILVSVQGDLQDEFTHSAYQLHELGYNLFATQATADVLEKNQVPCTVVSYPTEEDSSLPSCKEMIKNEEFGLVINIPTHNSKRLEDNYQMRRNAVDYGIPLLTNMNLVKMFADSVYKHRVEETMVGLEPKTLSSTAKRKAILMPGLARTNFTRTTPNILSYALALVNE